MKSLNEQLWSTLNESNDNYNYTSDCVCNAETCNCFNHGCNCDNCVCYSACDCHELPFVLE